MIYGKPSEAFVASRKPVDDDDEEDDLEDENEDAEPVFQAHQVPPAQATDGGMDLLNMGFGGETPPAVPRPANPPAFMLNPHAGMDAGLFQQKWGTLQPCQSTSFQFRALPPQVEIEQSLTAASIKTMASGDVGPQYKFFFYAQDDRGTYYLTEAIVEKSNGVLSATIKADDESGAPFFVNALQSALQRFTY